MSLWNLSFPLSSQKEYIIMFNGFPRVCILPYAHNSSLELVKLKLNMHINYEKYILFQENKQSSSLGFLKIYLRNIIMKHNFLTMQYFTERQHVVLETTFNCVTLAVISHLWICLYFCYCKISRLDQIKPYDTEHHKSYLSHGLEALFLLTGNSLFLSPNIFFHHMRYGERSVLMRE